MYEVHVEYDGCLNGKPRFTGTYDACIGYMRTRRPPRLCQWALVDCATRRCVSFCY